MVVSAERFRNAKLKNTFSFDIKYYIFKDITKNSMQKYAKCTEIKIIKKLLVDVNLNLARKV